LFDLLKYGMWHGSAEVAEVFNL